MNIFEALEKGNGKATVLGNLNLSYVYYDNGRFLARIPAWTLPQEVPYSALQHNDWIPYVPRGTCSNCGNTYPRKKIKLTPDWACNECGSLFTFETIPPQKVKHKKVFELVTWMSSFASSIGSVATHPCPIYPQIDFCSAEKLLRRPPMKMTLEWEE